MKEIIDSEIKSISGNVHSRKACWFFVANIVCILIMFFSLPRTIAADNLDAFYKVFNIILLIFIALGLLGFRFAMLSLVKKEKWTYIKIVGVIGNLLFFIIIILLFAANMNDVLKGI